MIAKAIVAGGSNAAVSRRFGVTESAVQRHRVNCLRAPRRAKELGSSGAPEGSGDSRRFVNGRCQACGILLDDPSPEALVKRAEAGLHRGETILDRALSDDDLRLALGALDRVRQSLDQLLKVHGLLQADGTVNVNIDARRQSATILASAPESNLRFITDNSVTDDELTACAEFLEQLRSGKRPALTA